MTLNEKDASILTELQQDSNQSLKRISKKLGIPMSTVHERIRKLEKDGTIKSYTALIDGEKVGRPTTAFVLLELYTTIPFDQKIVHPKTTAAEVAKLPGVQEVHVITGDKDILVKIKGASIREIGDLVLDKLIRIRGVKRTLTLEVLATAKESSEIYL